MFLRHEKRGGVGRWKGRGFKKEYTPDSKLHPLLTHSRLKKAIAHEKKENKPAAVCHCHAANTGTHVAASDGPLRGGRGILKNQAAYAAAVELLSRE